MPGALSVVLGREWPGCPAIWVGTSRDLGAHLGHLEELYLEGGGGRTWAIVFRGC